MNKANSNPVEWSLMLMELEEAREHIKSLEEQMVSAGVIDEEDLKVQIFHAISHLNRVWNSRNHQGDMSQEKHEQFAKTPNDFRPIG